MSFDSRALSRGAQLVVLRSYYLTAQLQTREIGNSLSIILRYTHGLEERAGSASLIVAWKLSDRLRLYNVTTAVTMHGKKNDSTRY